MDKNDVILFSVTFIVTFVLVGFFLPEYDLRSIGLRLAIAAGCSAGFLGSVKPKKEEKKERAKK